MIIFQSIIKELDVSVNKDVFYIITGNDKGRMKKSAGSDFPSFWLDDTFKANIMKFDEDVKAVKALLKDRSTIIYSSDLLGEDISKMKSFCPKTSEYMNDKLGVLLLQ